MPADDAARATAPEVAARRLLDLTLARPATLGSGRLVCIDGPAGSGKTTLAGALADLTEATVVHTDELLEGWSGLPRLGDAVAALLGPLADDRPSAWRRWDWHASAWAETVPVEPTGLLVLEGVGAWSPGISPLVTALAWVEAPVGVRMRRGIERDGEAFAPYWEQWARDEADLFARTRARDHADLLLATG